ncbi:hypothetical protein BJ546DRAFT_950352 [Cryomyces antarcticus]
MEGAASSVSSNSDQGEAHSVQANDGIRRARRKQHGCGKRGRSTANHSVVAAEQKTPQDTSRSTSSASPDDDDPDPGLDPVSHDVSASPPPPPPPPSPNTKRFHTSSAASTSAVGAAGFFAANAAICCREAEGECSLCGVKALGADRRGVKKVACVPAAAGVERVAREREAGVVGPGALLLLVVTKGACVPAPTGVHAVHGDGEGAVRVSCSARLAEAAPACVPAPTGVETVDGQGEASLCF